MSEIYEYEDGDEMRKEVVVEEKFCYEEGRELTVQKTSMFNQGDGFTVYDSKGVIIFRVDSFSPINHRLVLLDSSGKPLLTLLPKWPTLHQRWEGFKGEKTESQHQEPIFSIWKSTIIGRSSLMVEAVHHSGCTATYQIEGSYSERRCTIFQVSSSSTSSSSISNQHHHGTSKVSMAQINRKVEPTRNIMLGRDVFCLNLKAGFDAAFAMGLILALDRIYGDDANYPIIECHNKDIN